jgi:O-antigen ligase
VSEPSQHARSGVENRRADLIPLGLVLLLALFPPDTHGESMAGAALLIAFAALLIPSAWSDPRRGLPMLVLLAIAWPLGLVARAPGETLEPMVFVFLAGAVGLATAGLSRHARTGWSLPGVLTVAGALVSLYAVYQALWGLDALAARLAEGRWIADQEVLLARARSGRAFAAFVTPAALGGYLVLTGPVSVAAALESRGRRRWAFAVAALIILAGLVASVSATATLAGLVAVALAALRHRQLRSAVVVVAGLLLIVLAAVVLIRGREVVSFTDDESAWRLRGGNYRIAGEMIADHPWRGVGPGGFGEVYPQYRRPDDNESRHVHNLPLELGAELGVAGGLLTSGLFFALFLGPVLRRPPRSPRWWRGAEIGLAAFAVHNLADFTAFLPALLWIAAILRGWIAAEPEPPARWAHGIPSVVLRCAVVAAAALAVLAGLGENHRAAAVQAVIDEDPAEAEARARRAVRVAPWSTDGWLLLARISVEAAPSAEDPLQRLQQAMHQVDRAVDRSPVRPAAYYLRSQLRMVAGDAPGAWVDAGEAARLYPARDEYARHRNEMAKRLPRPATAGTGPPS